MKDPHLLSKVNCFYQSRDGQINIKNYNSLKDQLEIDSQPFKNENKLNGKFISFNLDLQNCLQRIHNMNLEPGSLIIFDHIAAKKEWKHRVPKQPKINDGRINITFRLR